MSTKPRPRPKLKPKGPSSNNVNSGSASKASSSRAIPITEKDDDSSYFNMSRPDKFVSKVVQQAQEERSASQNAPISINSDDDSGSPQSGEKRRHKDLALPSAPKFKKPDWTLDASKIAQRARGSTVMMESDESDGDSSPRPKRQQVSVDQGQRNRRQHATRIASSPSPSPPPEMTAAESARAKAIFSEQFPTSMRRSPSPPLYDTSFEGNMGLNLLPQERTARPRQASRNTQASSGKPEKIVIRVTWIPHPQHPLEQQKRMAYKMNRTDDLKLIYVQVATAVAHPINRIRLCYQGAEVSKLLTPDSFDDIWADAEFEAYADDTLAYIKDHRGSPAKSGTVQSNVPASEANRPLNADDDEGEGLGGDRIRLFLQSAASSKKVSVTARKTTTAMSLVKHYLSKMDIDLSEGDVRARKIRLAFDGDPVDYDTTVGDIEDGELDNDECLDIIGI